MKLLKVDEVAEMLGLDDFNWEPFPVGFHQTRQKPSRREGDV